MTISFPPSFAKSWMTSLVGLLSAIYPAVQGFKAFQTGDWTALFHDPLFWIAVLGAAQGFVSKDAQVTGGKVGQPSSLQAMVDANQTPSSVAPPAAPPADKPVVIPPAPDPVAVEAAMTAGAPISPAAPTAPSAATPSSRA